MWKGRSPMRERGGLVSLTMQVKGKRPVSHLVARLSGIDGVVQVGSLPEDGELD